MTEWTITSSLLILIVLLVRRLFRGKLSLRVQYALWLVVLLRLLVPGTVAQTGLSVLNYLPRLGAEVSQATVTAPAPADGGGAMQINPAGPAESGETVLPSAPAEPAEGGEAVPPAPAPLPWRSVLKGVWLAGVAAVAAALVLSNLRFYLRLRRVRRPFPVPGMELPVYTAPGLPSPCLYGFPRPAVYLTPAAAEDPAVLGHVLSHERTHCRHGDHIWAVLRGAALALHWYNPLVWCAAALSRADGELACDEGALRGADNPTRAAYGRALLRLVTAKPAAADLLCCATTMTAGKSGLKERIAMLAKKPKTLVTALTAAAFLIGLGVGCTFTGGRSERWEPLTEEELAFFNGDGFFNGDYLNIRNQFLSSTYETPEDIDLFALFYCGDGSAGSAAAPEGVDPAELERAMLDALGGAEPDCGATMLTTAQMDGVLEEYLGLTLAETSQVGLDQFTYLPEYDVYFHYHGDTNYRASVAFQSGEKNGELVRLTYDDAFMADGLKEVTLREQGDGWRFVSNLAVAEGDVLPLESRLAALPEGLAERVVVTQDGRKGLHGSGPVACYYYAPEYENDTVRGGSMIDVVRYAPVDFEQSGLWGDSDVLLLGRDGDWYYVCHGPKGVFYSDDNMEDYMSAYLELLAWLEELAADTGLTPMEEDLFYLRVSMNLSYQDGEHLSVAFRPDTGTSRAGTAEERVYTLVLSQPVTQGDTGIWCVDRWYDGDGEAHAAVPRGTGGLTMDEYYASLQAACDAGDRRDLLDPVKAALDFAEGYFEADYSTLAFQVLGPTDIADTFDLYLATATLDAEGP